MHKVWKVVSAWPDGSLRSAVVGNYRSGVLSKDIHDKWVRIYKNENGEICTVNDSIAFSTWVSAFEMYNDQDNSNMRYPLEVWEARCSERKSKRRVSIPGWLISWDWSTMDRRMSMLAPRDTVLCQELKLVRKLYLCSPSSPE